MYLTDTILVLTELFVDRNFSEEEVFFLRILGLIMTLTTLAINGKRYIVLIQLKVNEKLMLVGTD